MSVQNESVLPVVGNAALLNAPANNPLAEDRFAAIGAYGFKTKQIAILAALVSGDPLLLIGRSGTGKTFLLNSISEVLGLEHRHYNASLIAFDDLVGFPYPDEAREKVHFLETPATIWGAESVLIDEISRCKPEHQNRLFSLVHERRIQGIALESLRYRWAAMNPCSADQSISGEYLGSEPLDPALADRFAVVLEVGDWDDLSEAEQFRVANPSGEGALADDGGALQADIRRWQAAFNAQLANCPKEVADYARLVTGELSSTGLRISPRRARLIARTLLAAVVIDGESVARSFRTVLECSLPQRAWGEKINVSHVKAAHQLAWAATLGGEDERWLNGFHLKRKLHTKAQALADCPSADLASLAVEQLLAHERPERTHAFALAVFPAALSGSVQIGAEGLADLGKLAAAVLTVDGELTWQERRGLKDTSHPEFTRMQAVLADIDETARRARAEQLFAWAAVNDVVLDDPAALEQELHKTVAWLARRMRS